MEQVLYRQRRRLRIPVAAAPRDADSPRDAVATINKE